MDKLNIIQRMVLRRIVLRIAETIEEKYRRPPDMMTLFKIVEAFMGDNPHAHWECVDWASCWRPGIDIFEYSKKLKKKYPGYEWRYVDPLPVDEVEIYWEGLELGIEEHRESLEQVIDKWFTYKMSRLPLSGWRETVFKLSRIYLTLLAKLIQRICSFY